MKFQHHSLPLLALCALAVWGAVNASAIEPEAVRDDTYPQLSQGDLKSMALTSEGYLAPSYARRVVGDTRNEIVWDARREPNGILCATGHHGKLVRLVDGKTTKTVATLPEPELTALAPFKDGSVLVAAAPTGRIYRLSADDKLTTWTQLKAKFVWRLVPDTDGSVWAVTGTEGRLFRLSEDAGKARVEEVAKFKSANLLDLWIDHEGLLGTKGDVYVAGQNPGWLYRYNPTSKKTEVAFNPQAEEIRRLLPTRDGLVMALNTERSPSPQALSLTLRMSGGPGGMAMGAPSGSPMGGSGTPPPPPPDQSLNQAFAPAGQANYGMPRSDVVILDRSGFVRTIWQSPDRPIHDLALSPANKILAAAGNQGRLFEISPLNGEYAVVADVREDYLMRIVADEKGYLLAAARNGVVFDMSRDLAAEAVFVSRPLDAGKLVNWGHLYLRGDIYEGQKAQFSFRIGNDGDPDSDFWGPWTPAVDVTPQQAVALPAGPSRFIQYRLTFRSAAGQAKPPRMEWVDLFYIGRNAAPKVIQVLATEAAPTGPPRTSASSPASSPGEGGSAAASSGGGSSPQNQGATQNPGGARTPRSNPMSLNISWRVVDPNGDALRYSVYFKADDETEWKLIDKDLSVTQMPLSVAGLADGHFRFKVVATDELSNPPGLGQHDSGISNEVLVDNTPPTIENKAVKIEGQRALLSFDAADNLSLLSAVRVDLDNGFDYPLLPADGILDQPRESFRWLTKSLRPGEHVATISVTDARGNTSVDKVIFNIPK